MRNPDSVPPSGSKRFPRAPLWLGILSAFAILLSGRAGGLFAAPQKEIVKGESSVAIVSFATLGYMAPGASQMNKIPAENLSEIRLLQGKDERDFWVELFFHNDDYVLQKVHNLTFFQKDGSVPLGKVRILLGNRKAIRFPLVY